MQNTLKFKSILFLLAVILTSSNCTSQEIESQGGYTLIINGYDWGPGANKVVLSMEEEISEAKASDFSVTAERSAEGVEMSPHEAQGDRKVVYAYVSDEQGNRIAKGNHITLVMFVSPEDPLSSPIKYIFQNGRGSNQWIDYTLSITHTTSGKSWNTEAGRIWLHGGGEGGTDPSIAMIANKATNYASEEIQSIFGGAYVLVPQTPTFWMQSASGDYTRGKENDIYNEALMGLIEEYVKDHSGIDVNRIYVGGCSNGGYMSLKLLLLYPDYFAAAYISALAYHEKYITDEHIESIKNKPIWFVHSKDDPVTKPDETVVPLYHRLMGAGATNVHFSYYDHVTDLSGVYGGKEYRYNGHWSWIYSHANHADFDFDGKPVMVEGMPVTLMEWMAQQHK